MTENDSIVVHDIRYGPSKNIGKFVWQMSTNLRSALARVYTNYIYTAHIHLNGGFFSRVCCWAERMLIWLSYMFSSRSLLTEVLCAVQKDVRA